MDQAMSLKWVGSLPMGRYHNSNPLVKDLVYLIGLLAGLMLGPRAHSLCSSNPETLFAKALLNSDIYLCESETESEICTSNEKAQCRKVDLMSGFRLLSSSEKVLSSTQTPSAQRFLKSQSPKKMFLASYLSSMNFRGNYLIDQKLSLQVGRYPLASVSLEALNSKCMATIVQTAYKLHKYFPDYNFVVDSTIQNCENLNAGIRRLVAERDRVKRNLNQFHSPLHSVYLTSRTMFVQKELGSLGLHINVNRSGEIERRLINFEISAVPTDGPPLQLSGL